MIDRKPLTQMTDEEVLAEIDKLRERRRLIREEEARKRRRGKRKDKPEPGRAAESQEP